MCSNEGLNKKQSFDPDDGMDRRYKTVRYSRKYVDMANPLAARRAADRRKRRGPEHLRNVGEDDDDDDDHAASVAQATVARPPGMTDVEYWTSFPGARVPRATTTTTRSVRAHADPTHRARRRHVP